MKIESVTAIVLLFIWSGAATVATGCNVGSRKMVIAGALACAETQRAQELEVPSDEFECAWVTSTQVKTTSTKTQITANQRPVSSWSLLTTYGALLSARRLTESAGVIAVQRTFTPAFWGQTAPQTIKLSLPGFVRSF